MFTRDFRIETLNVKNVKNGSREKRDATGSLRIPWSGPYPLVWKRNGEYSELVSEYETIPKVEIDEALSILVCRLISRRRRKIGGHVSGKTQIFIV